jgi:hypothetical protein
MRIKDYIQNNPFRGMGVATSDSSTTLSSNNSRMKAYAAIGKSVSFPMDMDIVFGAKADRSQSSLVSYMSSLSVPKDRLRHGLFWFMNLTETDAHALEVLRQTGDLLQVRKLWEDGEQNISALQNQLVCCLLKDPRSYSKAIQVASHLYERYGSELIQTISNGFNVITPEKLLPMFLEEIVVASDGDCWWWDKAVKRSGISHIDDLWTEAKATSLIDKIEQALNVAQSSECRNVQAHYDLAYGLMKQTEPMLKSLKALSDAHPVLLSRYSTIAEAVGEFVLHNEIEYYNHIGWVSGLTERSLELERFCYRYAATVRFKDRCRLNINITMGRKEDAPLFPNGTPDKLTFESERKKRNAGISAILSGLMPKG